MLFWQSPPCRCVRRLKRLTRRNLNRNLRKLRRLRRRPVSTAAAAQKLVKTISGDKAKTQTYCDIGKLGSQIEDAEQKKDMNKIDELNKKMDEMATKLGPEYVALMARLEDIDPNSKEALEIGSALETLDKLCAK